MKAPDHLAAPEDTNSQHWQDLGFDAEASERWLPSGLAPNAAAMARGAGWTPTGARHRRRLLLKILARWAGAGFDPLEALRWHLAMFTPPEASVWRRAGFDPIAAGIRRAQGRTPSPVSRPNEP